MELKPVDDLSVEVAFDLPVCLYLPDGGYPIKRGGHLATIHLTQVAQTHLDPRLGIESGSAELSHDRFGRLRYSHVKVVIPGRAVLETELRNKVDAGVLTPTDGILSVTVSVEEIISGYGEAAYDATLFLVNRLIEIYRHQSDEFHVRRLAPEDVFKADIGWYQDSEPLGGHLKLGFGHGLTAPPALAAETVEGIKGRLLQDGPVHPAIDLFLDAKDYLSRREYRLAVIDARTALEVLVDQVLAAYFAVQKKDIDEICQALGVDPKRVASLEEALQRAEINRKLGHGLKQALGLDLHDGDPKLWQRWLKAKELREAGAHRGHVMGRTEAVDALNAMGSIIDELMKKFAQADWASPAPS